MPASAPALPAAPTTRRAPPSSAPPPAPAAAAAAAGQPLERRQRQGWPAPRAGTCWWPARPRSRRRPPPPPPPPQQQRRRPGRCRCPRARCCQGRARRRAPERRLLAPAAARAAAAAALARCTRRRACGACWAAAGPGPGRAAAGVAPVGGEGAVGAGVWSAAHLGAAGMCCRGQGWWGRAPGSEGGRRRGGVAASLADERGGERQGAAPAAAHLARGRRGDGCDGGVHHGLQLAARARPDLGQQRLRPQPEQQRRQVVAAGQLAQQQQRSCLQLRAVAAQAQAACGGAGAVRAARWPGRRGGPASCMRRHSPSRPCSSAGSLATSCGDARPCLNLKSRFWSARVRTSSSGCTAVEQRVHV
jgi:hypothetical protein